MQKGLQFTHAANKAAQGDKPSRRPPTGSLTTDGDVMGGGVKATGNFATGARIQPKSWGDETDPGKKLSPCPGGVKARAHGFWGA